MEDMGVDHGDGLKAVSDEKTEEQTVQMEMFRGRAEESSGNL